MIRNLTELVVLVENQLGWLPPEHLPTWKARSVEISKIRKKLGLKKGEEVSREVLDRLETTVLFLQHERETVRSPVGVLYWVDAAHRGQEAPAPARPLDELIESALRQELAATRPGWEEWAGRLSRAFGDFRQEVYDAWLAERGQP